LLLLLLLGSEHRLLPLALVVSTSMAVFHQPGGAAARVNLDVHS
jgi:hypothetical protein